MQSNVILILRTFSQEELRAFDEFLNSPFHNKNKKVIQFFDLLKKNHPGYKDENLSKEKLFRQMFGREKFKESYIRNLFSDLNILSEKFLQHYKIKNDPNYEKFLIETLNDRNLRDIMEKKLNIFERKIKPEKIKDQMYYTNKVFVYEAKSYLLVDKTLTDSFRSDQMQSTIKLFLLTMLEFSFYLFVEEQRVKIKHNFEFIRLLLNFMKSNISDFKESSLLMIYYYLCQSFLDKEHSDVNFSASRKIFKKNFNALSQIDKKNIYSMFQTYCSNKIDQGFTSYNRELLDILMEMLKFNVTSHRGNIINLNLYRNILILCITLKEMNMLKQFVRKYLKIVDSSTRRSLSAYSSAHLHFLSGNFEKSMELSNQINFNDLLVTANENLFFKNDIKKLLLMSLYELGFIENAISSIDAFKHFLNNSKLIREDIKKKNLNFINYVNGLIKLKLNFDEYELRKLLLKIKNENEIVYKDWIIEKCNALTKRRVS